MKFAKGLSSPVRELAFSQIPFGATVEGLVEMAFFNTATFDASGGQQKKDSGHGKRKNFSNEGGQSKRQAGNCRRCNMRGHEAKDYRVDMTKLKFYNCNHTGHIKRQCSASVGNGRSTT